MHMKALKRGLPPMHPGELLADVLPATGKTITEVADLIGISRQMLSMIVNGHARVTPDVAALLGKVLGNGPGLWLRLQADWDAEHIDPAIRAKVERIRTLEALNGVRECYLRMLDMAQENMVAGLDLARELGSVKTPMEFVEVWNAGTREAYGTFSEQTKELSELAQKVATSTVQPLTKFEAVHPIR